MKTWNASRGIPLFENGKLLQDASRKKSEKTSSHWAQLGGTGRYHQLYLKYGDGMPGRSSASVAYSRSNWKMEFVTVCGIDDDLVENDTKSTIWHKVESKDPWFSDHVIFRNNVTV
jgi:hypothetical protein